MTKQEVMKVVPKDIPESAIDKLFDLAADLRRRMTPNCIDPNKPFLELYLPNRFVIGKRNPKGVFGKFGPAIHLMYDVIDVTVDRDNFPVIMLANSEKSFTYDQVKMDRTDIYCIIITNNSACCSHMITANYKPDWEDYPCRMNADQFYFSELHAVRAFVRDAGEVLKGAHSQCSSILNKITIVENQILAAATAIESAAKNVAHNAFIEKCKKCTGPDAPTPKKPAAKKKDDHKKVKPLVNKHDLKKISDADELASQTDPKKKPVKK